MKFSCCSKRFCFMGNITLKLAVQKVTRLRLTPSCAGEIYCSHNSYSFVLSVSIEFLFKTILVFVARNWIHYKGSLTGEIRIVGIKIYKNWKNQKYVTCLKLLFNQHRYKDTSWILVWMFVYAFWFRPLIARQLYSRLSSLLIWFLMWWFQTSTTQPRPEYSTSLIALLSPSSTIQ